MTSLSTYDFSTLYTTLPHNLIKEKLLDLIEHAFKKIFKNEGTLYLACNNKKAVHFHRGYNIRSFQNVGYTLTFPFENINIRFSSMLYRHIVGISMCSNCVSLVANLFLFCYERDFTTSLSHNNQADTIEAFNSTSGY